MEQNHESNGFKYTYSAKEQAELRAIRDKYRDAPKKEESPLERLRRLDANVAKKAATVALIVGILGALIMGSGMSLVMSPLGEGLGMEPLTYTLVGIGLGVLGILLVCLAYPIYAWILKRERKKIAPEILRLTDELMK